MSAALKPAMQGHQSIPTRASLLARLKDLGDEASWNQFYDLYHDLIFGVAQRAGLTEIEAREVVQDTLISVAKKMPAFTYDPTKDSFRGWLLTVTRWRVRDQLAKRTAHRVQTHSRGQADAETHTASIDRVPDPAGPEFEAIWEQEWETQVLQTALARIKRRVRPQHYEMYHLQVMMGQSASEVARTLEVSPAQVYLAKHRVGNLLKKEVRKIRETLL